MAANIEYVGKVSDWYPPLKALYTQTLQDAKREQIQTEVKSSFSTGHAMLSQGKISHHHSYQCQCGSLSKAITLGTAANSVKEKGRQKTRLSCDWWSL
jgi:hypothetical protein